MTAMLIAEISPTWIFVYALLVMGVLGLLLGLFLVIAEKFVKDFNAVFDCSCFQNVLNTIKAASVQVFNVFRCQILE